MPPFHTLRTVCLVAGPLLAAPCLLGCELIAAGPFMPGLAPGVGQPLTGQVLDARTRLPVGGATVIAGLGSTVTDGQGRFKLYGSLSSKELSFARAGYSSLTLGGQAPDPSQPLTVTLEPYYAKDGALPSRFLELRGQVVGTDGQPVAGEGLVALGQQTSTLSNGAYQISYGGQVPGKIVTAVLAWGQTSAPYSASGQFSFLNFAYRVDSWPLGETVPEGTIPNPAPLVVRPDSPRMAIQVNYSNTAAFSAVQTEVALDFGVAGSVPVARAMASNQQITVPQVTGLKYVITGKAVDSSGRLESTVNITTNDPRRASFQLLSPPKVKSPASGASQAGQRPTFAWTEINVPGVLYELKLFEGDKNSDTYDARPKWVCRTTLPSVQFPAFSMGDVNGGALRPDKKYTWVIKAIDLLDATETPSGARDIVPIKPYRVRERASAAMGNTFTL